MLHCMALNGMRGVHNIIRMYSSSIEYKNSWFAVCTGKAGENDYMYTNLINATCGLCPWDL